MAGANSRTPMSLIAASTGSPQSPIRVSCKVSGGNGSVSSVKLALLPVGSIG